MVTQHYPLPLAVAERAMREFCNQWFAGLKPQLCLETHPNGQILVSTTVAAENAFIPVRPNPPPPQPHEHKPRHKSPSQIRRQKKRALAAKRASPPGVYKVHGGLIFFPSA